MTEFAPFTDPGFYAHAKVGEAVSMDAVRMWVIAADGFWCDFLNIADNLTSLSLCHDFAASRKLKVRT